MSSSTHELTSCKKLDDDDKPMPRRAKSSIENMSEDESISPAEEFSRPKSDRYKSKSPEDEDESKGRSSKRARKPERPESRAISHDSKSNHSSRSRHDDSLRRSKARYSSNSRDRRHRSRVQSSSDEDGPKSRKKPKAYTGESLLRTSKPPDDKSKRRSRSRRDDGNPDDEYERIKSRRDHKSGRESDRSLRHEGSDRSLRHKGSDRSLRHKGSDRSLRHEGSDRSLRHKSDKSPRHKGSDRSSRHKTSDRALRHESDRSPTHKSERGSDRSTKHKSEGGSDRSLRQKDESDDELLVKSQKEHMPTEYKSTDNEVRSKYQKELKSSDEENEFTLNDEPSEDKTEGMLSRSQEEHEQINDESSRSKSQKPSDKPLEDKSERRSRDNDKPQVDGGPSEKGFESWEECKPEPPENGLEGGSKSWRESKPTMDEESPEGKSKGISKESKSPYKEPLESKSERRSKSRGVSMPTGNEPPEDGFERKPKPWRKSEPEFLQGKSEGRSKSSRESKSPNKPLKDKSERVSEFRRTPDYEPRSERSKREHESRDHERSQPQKEAKPRVKSHKSFDREQSQGKNDEDKRGRYEKGSKSITNKLSIEKSKRKSSTKKETRSKSSDHKREPERRMSLFRLKGPPQQDDEGSICSETPPPERKKSSILKFFSCRRSKSEHDNLSVQSFSRSGSSSQLDSYTEDDIDRYRSAVPGITIESHSSNPTDSVSREHSRSSIDSPADENNIDDSEELTENSSKSAHVYPEDSQESKSISSGVDLPTDGYGSMSPGADPEVYQDHSQSSLEYSRATEVDKGSRHNIKSPDASPEDLQRDRGFDKHSTSHNAHPDGKDSSHEGKLPNDRKSSKGTKSAPLLESVKIEDKEDGEYFKFPPVDLSTSKESKYPDDSPEDSSTDEESKYPPLKDVSTCPGLYQEDSLADKDSARCSPGAVKDSQAKQGSSEHSASHPPTKESTGHSNSEDNSSVSTESVKDKESGKRLIDSTFLESNQENSHGARDSESPGAVNDSQTNQEHFTSPDAHPKDLSTTQESKKSSEDPKSPINCPNDLPTEKEHNAQIDESMASHISHNVYSEDAETDEDSIASDTEKKGEQSNRELPDDRKSVKSQPYEDSPTHPEDQLTTQESKKYSKSPGVNSEDPKSPINRPEDLPTEKGQIDESIASYISHNVYSEDDGDSIASDTEKKGEQSSRELPDARKSVKSLLYEDSDNTSASTESVKDKESRKHNKFPPINSEFNQDNSHSGKSTDYPGVVDDPRPNQERYTSPDSHPEDQSTTQESKKCSKSPGANSEDQEHSKSPIYRPDDPPIERGHDPNTEDADDEESAASDTEKKSFSRGEKSGRELADDRKSVKSLPCDDSEENTSASMESVKDNESRKHIELDSTSPAFTQEKSHGGKSTKHSDSPGAVDDLETHPKGLPATQESKRCYVDSSTDESTDANQQKGVSTLGNVDSTKDSGAVKESLAHEGSNGRYTQPKGDQNHSEVLPTEKGNKCSPENSQTDEESPSSDKDRNHSSREEGLPNEMKSKNTKSVSCEDSEDEISAKKKSAKLGKVPQEDFDSENVQSTADKMPRKSSKSKRSKSAMDSESSPDNSIAANKMTTMEFGKNPEGVSSKASSDMLSTDNKPVVTSGKSSESVSPKDSLLINKRKTKHTMKSVKTTKSTSREVSVDTKSKKLRHYESEEDNIEYSCSQEEWYSEDKTTKQSSHKSRITEDELKDVSDLDLDQVEWTTAPAEDWKTAPDIVSAEDWKTAADIVPGHDDTMPICAWENTSAPYEEKPLLYPDESYYHSNVQEAENTTQDDQCDDDYQTSQDLKVVIEDIDNGASKPAARNRNDGTTGGTKNADDNTTSLQTSDTTAYESDDLTTCGTRSASSVIPATDRSRQPAGEYTMRNEKRDVVAPTPNVTPPPDEGECTVKPIKHHKGTTDTATGLVLM
jgi:hypothetical protein